MGVQERAGTNEQRTDPVLDERCKGGLDVAVAADIENDELLPDRLCRGVHVSAAFHRARSLPDRCASRYGRDKAGPRTRRSSCGRARAAG
jgi:hypothetical protein